MAIAILANVKGALIFAGGVTVSAVLIAGSMGSQFTPQARDGYEAQEDAPEERERVSKPDRPALASNTNKTTDQEFFGDFSGFADDTELIDDTSGFDPTPQNDSSVFRERAPSFDDGGPAEPSGASSARARKTSPFGSSTRAVSLETGERDRPASRQKLANPEKVAGFKKAER